MSITPWYPYGSTHKTSGSLHSVPKVYRPVRKPIIIPKIDFSKENIIIWVPGTNDHKIPDKFLNYISQHFKDTFDAVLCDYMATWDLVKSSEDGKETLRAVLDYVIKNKKLGTKIYLAGVSQGSLVIGDVLSEPKYYNAVSKVCLLGHPGVTKFHYNDAKVKELNNPLDATTFYWAGDPNKILEGISNLTNYNLSGIPHFLWIILRNPLQAAWLGVVSLRNIPLYNLNNIIPDAHNYTESLDEAASWLSRK